VWCTADLGPRDERSVADKTYRERRGRARIGGRSSSPNGDWARTAVQDDVSGEWQHVLEPNAHDGRMTGRSGWEDRNAGSILARSWWTLRSVVSGRARLRRAGGGGNGPAFGGDHIHEGRSPLA